MAGPFNKSYFAKPEAIKAMFGLQAFNDFKRLMDPCCGIGLDKICTSPCGGGGTPSLPLNSVQYNNAGAFFGDVLFTRDPVTNETIIGLTGTDLASNLQITPTGNTITWDADTTDTIETKLEQSQSILGLGGLSGSALTWQDTGTEIVGFVGAGDASGSGLFPGTAMMVTNNLATGASAIIVTNYDNVNNIAVAIANVANGDFDSGFKFDDTETLIKYKNNTTGLDSSIRLDANSVITAYTLDGTTEYQTVLGDGRFKIFDSTNNIKYLIIDIINSSMTINPTLVPTYADDAAAGVGGLTSGQLYKTATGGSTFLKIVP
jgi:hypothetical protein